MPRIVLGLSGGVDSAASAILLQKSGCEVFALYLNNTGESAQRAQATAQALGVPFAVADTRECFRTRVVEPFLDAYLRGETPNPCVECNLLVKFQTLFDYADSIGAGFVATGHYARIRDGLICRSAGINDQSYMLWQLRDQWLPRLRFPLGDFLTKDEVRAVAAQGMPSLPVPKPSMDVCFIPSGDYAAYIAAHRTVPPPGDFIDENGRILGRHQGIHRYTVGMRRHLGIALGERMYVRHIDPVRNTVMLAPLKDPAPVQVEAAQCHWFAPAQQLVQPGASFDARVRHSRRTGRAQLLRVGDGCARLLVEPSCGTPAPGQSIVLYDGTRMLGGGKIVKIQ